MPVLHVASPLDGLRRRPAPAAARRPRARRLRPGLALERRQARDQLRHRAVRLGRRPGLELHRRGGRDGLVAAHDQRIGDAPAREEGARARRRAGAAASTSPATSSSARPRAASRTGPPVATKGTIKVFKITQGAAKPGRHFEEIRTLVHEEPHATDAKGVGFFRWQPDVGGHFAIVFEALDRFEQLVDRRDPHLDLQARRDLPRLRVREHRARPRQAHVQARPTAEDPREVRAAAKAAVFWSIDAGPKMLQVRHARSRGQARRDRAADRARPRPEHLRDVLAVSGGKFFEDRVELFVPPDDRFLDVKLALREGRRTVPARRGDLVVTTKTSSGAPIAARLAVTVLDASILAIQADESSGHPAVLLRRAALGQHAARLLGRAQLGGYLARDVKWGKYDDVDGLPAWERAESRLRLAALPRRGLRHRTSSRRWATQRRRHVEGQEGVRRGAAEAGRRGDALAPAAPRRAGGRARDAGRRLREGRPDAEAEGSGSRTTTPRSAQATTTPATEQARRHRRARTSATRRSGRPGRRPTRPGTATVKVPFPESLTTWRAKAWAWTQDTLVGQATADVKTTKDVLVRLRAPRFFVQGDSITVAALVNNRTDKPQSARVKIALDGSTSRRAQPARDRRSRSRPNADRRVDWTVNVLEAGQTKIAAQVVAQADQDALEMTFPVLEWGHDKILTRGAVLENDATAELAFKIPAERRVETTALELGAPAEPRADAARRPPLPRRLPLRVHRADHEPVHPGGDRREGARRRRRDARGHRGRARRRRRSSASATTARVLSSAELQNAVRGGHRAARVDAARRRRLRLVEGRPLLAVPDRLRPLAAS